MTFIKGQKVDYHQIVAGGPKLIRDWQKGYVVVAPVSPHNAKCVLIQKIGAIRPFDQPFNAEFASVRLAKRAAHRMVTRLG